MSSGFMPPVLRVSTPSSGTTNSSNLLSKLNWVLNIINLESPKGAGDRKR